MKRKENGITILNLIILIAIIVACFFIYSTYINDTNVKTSSTNKIEISNDTSLKINATEKQNDVEGKNASAGIENIVLSENVTKGSSDLQSNSENDFTRYYYNQIDNTAKSMYNDVLKNEDKLISGTGIIEFTTKELGAENRFQTAWDALCMDHPELFFIDTNKLSLKTRTTKSFFGAKTTYDYFLEPSDNSNYYASPFESETDVRQAISTLNTYVDAITQEANNRRTTYDKVKFVHDYLVNNTSYAETEGNNTSNLYGALVNHLAVCEGYAESFKYLMDKLNIPCVVVYGDGLKLDGSEEYHAWNYVKMDNENWYAVDATWDDPIIIGEGRLLERNKYIYFLKGSNSFSKRHVEKGDVSGTGQNFTYPVISTNDY